MTRLSILTVVEYYACEVFLKADIAPGRTEPWDM